MQHLPINAYRKDRDQLENTGSPIAAERVWRRSRGEHAGKARQMELLSRLERHGLVQNTGRGQRQGAPNQWRLTPAGQQLEQGIREHQEQAA